MTTKENTHILSVKNLRPESHHRHSHRSSSVSHEFTSDYASEVSSTSRKGYETPPSRISTPGLPHAHNDMTLPRRPAASLLAPLNTQHDAQGATRIPRDLNSMSPPTPGIDDTPYIRFAIEQLSFDEELAGRGRYSTYAQAVGIPSNVSAEWQAASPPPVPARDSEQHSRRPQHFRFPSSSSKPHTRTQEVLLPVDPPEGNAFSKLGYVPPALRLYTLGLLLLICLLMIAGIIFSNIYTLRHSGLYDYDGNTTSRHFVFQYLPALLGMIVLLWLIWTQAAIYRVLPYFGMSDEMPHDRVLQDMPILPANFVLPDLRFFRLGEPLVGMTLLIFWFMNFTIPLLGCFYGTQYYPYLETPRWRWTSVQGVGWTLTAMYLLLLAPICYCILRFRPYKSALTADTSSIVDVIALFQRSNVLLSFDKSEVVDDLRNKIPPQILRLGYWTPSQTPETFHAVGQNNAPLNRLSVRLEKSTFSAPDQSAASFDIERHRYSHDSAFTRDIHSPRIRYRWCPWFLRDAVVLAWAIAAILLLIVFLVVSFVRRAVQDGFFPLLPSNTRSDGSSQSNILYSFLPALLGQILFLCWQPIDVFYRSIQPYANLANPAGTTAQRSLLQTYSAQPHFLVTFSALLNRDMKLAWITLVSLLAAVLPVLAGGVFTAAQFRNGDIRMVASMPGYIAMCVFLSIYAFSYLIVWPGRRRYLPHPVDTIAGQLSFLYASPLLHDPSIRGAQSKADLVARLSGHVAPVSANSQNLNEKAVLTGEGRRRPRIRDRLDRTDKAWIDRQLKYAFGVYIGRDGKEHLGIDRLQRPGSGEMLIVTGTRRSLGSRSQR